MIRDGYRAATIPLQSKVKEEVCVSSGFEEGSAVFHLMAIAASSTDLDCVCVE